MSDNNDKNPENPFASMTEWGKAAGLASTGTLLTRTPPPQAPLAPPGLLDSFAPYLKRPVVQGLYYNNKIIKLDGFRFIGCRFDNCKLMVSSSNFEIESCIIDPSTTVEYHGEMAKIIRLYNSRNEWAFSTTPGFAPRRNADGTITISGDPQ